MVTIYVDGKKVKKEDLESIEIKKESVKRMLSRKILQENRKGA